MNPETQQFIEQKIREHRHDGLQAEQVNKDDLFGAKPTIYINAQVVAYATDNATGDGKYYFHIPHVWRDYSLIEVHAEVITAGTTGTEDIQIANVTQSLDMLSTKLTIDSTETGSDTAATPYVINTANSRVAENDLIRIDIDAVHTTAAKGLIVTLGFREFRTQ
jgi:hypothetical protein